MNKKKKLIGIAISFLLMISIINPLQVEAEAIIESSVYISSIKENYTYDNTKFKTIKSKSRHKIRNKSKVKLKKRSIRTKKYGYQTINKYKRQNARRHNILTKLILSIIVIFLVIVLVVLIFIKRKKKKFY